MTPTRIATASVLVLLAGFAIAGTAVAAGGVPEFFGVGAGSSASLDAAARGDDAAPNVAVPPAITPAQYDAEYRKLEISARDERFLADRLAAAGRLDRSGALARPGAAPTPPASLTGAEFGSIH